MIWSESGIWKLSKSTVKSAGLVFAPLHELCTILTGRIRLQSDYTKFQKLLRQLMWLGFSCLLYLQRLASSFLTTMYRNRHPFVQVVIPPNYHLFELILKMFRYPTPASIPSNQPSPERATQSNPLRGPNWKCRHPAPAKGCIIWQVYRTALIYLIVCNVNIKSYGVTIFSLGLAWTCINLRLEALLFV